MYEEKPEILAVVGPTASGKTSLALSLAERLGGEIVSCDSMQVYRRMDIGTAKPTALERRGIVHHMIDVAEPTEPFSAADYVAQATDAIRQIVSRRKLPILCGGTGLYLDALLRGGFEETAVDPLLRRSLEEQLERIGAHGMHERLRQIDPESAAQIHENNTKRVLRALEIYEGTGRTKTETDRLSTQREPPYRAVVLGLRYEARDVLYERIAARVRQMLADGLLEETRRLDEEGVFERNATAAQAIGYKELLAYLHGEESLDRAVERLITATRRYAKRQLTWFGAKDYVRWIDMERDGHLVSAEEISKEAIRILRKARRD